MDLSHVLRAFPLGDEPITVADLSGGLINRSYVVTADRGGHPTRFVLQRVNPDVFPDPLAVVRNSFRVCRSLATGAFAPNTSLTQMPTVDGEPGFVDADGAVWRVTWLIENTHVSFVLHSSDLAHAGAQIFGEFARKLAAIPDLEVTLPEFHQTSRYFAELLAVAPEDCPDTAQLVRYSDLAESDWPMIPGFPNAHQDAKMGNLLLDDSTGRPLCVIDLDTCQPGSAWLDLADFVRSGAALAAEDADPATQGVQWDLLDACLHGFAEGADLVDGADEAAHAVRRIVFEQACRFLADHHRGNIYYRCEFPGHNLVRARNQIVLLQSLDPDRLLAVARKAFPGTLRSR